MAQLPASDVVTPPPAESGAPEIYTIVEEMAEFPGGMAAMHKYIASQIIFPAEAREAGISGKCFIKFVVTSEGKITNVELLKGVPGCPECDKEALRVVKSMPNWKPGRMQGKTVNTYYNLPISFGIGKSGADERPTGLSIGKSENLSEAKPLTPEEKAKQESHKKAMNYYDLGIKQAQQERWEFALAKFDQCLTIEPDNRVALSDKANMHIKLMQKKEACETWLKYKSFGYQSDKVEEYIKKYCN